MTTSQRQKKRIGKRSSLAKKQGEQPTMVRINYDRMKQVSALVNLHDVLLVRSQWESFVSARRGDIPSDSLNYTHNLLQAHWDFDSDRNSLEVWLEYQVTAFADLQKKPLPLFALTCSLAVVFGVPDGFDPADASVMADFAVANGQLNSFPYFRQHVQDTTSKAGWPPLVLPTFRIPANRPDNAGSRLLR